MTFHPKTCQISNVLRRNAVALVVALGNPAGGILALVVAPNSLYPRSWGI